MEPLVHRAFHQPPLLPPDARAAAFLQGAGPFDLEIGCGVGLHPIRYALANPDRKLVAIEHTREKFEKFARRYRNNGEPAQLLPVHANAVSWVHQFASNDLFERIHLLYPNPEVKNPAKRWIRMPFFGRLLETLKPGGEVIFATNLRDYAEEIRDHAKRAWNLDVVEFRAFTLPDVVLTKREPRTHFEMKYLQRGETCFDVRLRKKGES